MLNLEPNNPMGLSCLDQSDAAGNLGYGFTGLPHQVYALIADTTKATLTIVWALHAKPETDFERQKRLFQAIPGDTLANYHDRFVASREGEIVDSDIDLPALTNRFFRAYGDVPVYITKVGERRQVLLRTPHPAGMR